MKKREILTLIFVISLFQIFSLPISKAISNDTIENVTIGIDEWPPYHSKELSHYGFCTHIIVEAFAAVGVDTQIQFMPWKRALNNPFENVAPYASVWGGYTDWIDTHYGSDPVCKGEYVLFILKGLDLDFNKPETFSGLIMGNLIGEGVPDQFQQFVADGILNVESTATVKSIFQMLANNRIHMTAINRSAGMVAMRKHLTKKQQDSIAIHPDQLRISLYRLVANKKYKVRSIKLIEKFNIGLDILRSSGRMREIIEAENKGEYEK